MSLARRLSAVCTLLLVSTLAAAESEAPRLRVGTVVPEFEGSVGGVTVDKLGFVYVADFGETVWRVSPQGTVEVFADSLYGASGNTIAPDGSLLQANFHANTITRIARDGSTSTFATGLQGPVGLAVGDEGEVYACNCQSNEIVRIAVDGSVAPFAQGDLFNCPNGITRDPEGNLYVVNFSDGRVLRVDSTGETTLLATLPGGGNGHIVWVGPDLYATAFRANSVYRIALDGSISAAAGNGRFGQVDHDVGVEAQMATPNGIGYDRTRNQLYTNDYLNPWGERFTGRFDPRSSLRVLAFPTLQESFSHAFETGGTEAAFTAVQDFVQNRPGSPYEIVLNAYGYGRLQGGDLAAALAVFEINTRLFPQSFNVWDSYAEALRAAGRQDESIANYRRSLELNPNNSNAVQMLKELGAD